MSDRTEHKAGTPSKPAAKGTTPRRHHYNAEFNLAFFTSSASRDDRLNVILVPSGKRLPLLPREIGFENGLYTVPDIPDVDPVAFEKAFALFEGRAAPAIRRLIQTERFPPNDSEDRSLVINYLALQTARVPAAMERLKELKDLLDHLELRRFAASPDEVRARMQQVAARTNASPPTDDDVREMAAIIGDRAFEIERHQGELVGEVLWLHNTLLQMFARRWWVVAVRRTEPYLFTSDNPVVLAWSGAERPSFGSLGWGQPHTRVTIPLSRHVALVGTFERPDESHVALNRLNVAAFNTEVIRKARRFIAGPDDNLVWLDDATGIPKIADAGSLAGFWQRRDALLREERQNELAEIDRLVPLPSLPSAETPD